MCREAIILRRTALAIWLGTAALLASTTSLASGQASPNFSMPTSAVNNGVGDLTSPNFRLSSSLGDAVATVTIASVSFQLKNGFRASVNAPPAVLNLLSVVSRKFHGATPFDLTIDRFQPITGTITVEPRGSGAGGGGHTLVFHFDNTINAEGAATALDAALNSAATVTLVRSGNDVIATLTNVADNQRLTLKLTGVNGTNTAEVSLAFLVGDVTNSRSVNAADIAAVKANLGKPVTSIDKAKFDLNADGSITSADLSAAKARSGKVIP